MRAPKRNAYGITHSLTPNLQLHEPNIIDYEIPEVPEKRMPILAKKHTFINPLTQRSKKHRLAEERST